MCKFLKDDDAIRVMRMNEVISVTGYSRSSIYNLMAAGTFPKCKKLGARAVGWNAAEVQAWIKSRLEQEDV